MTSIINDISMRKAAIVSGVAILIMTVAAVVATNLTIGSLIVKNDAVTTTNNIITSKVLFRIGIFNWLIILICDVLAAWGLYIFLKPVNNHLSLLMAWFRLVYVGILGVALLNYINVLLLITGENYVSAFGIEKFQSQVMLSLDAFNNMWSIGLLVFGFHIFLLGYLAFKSGYIPKIWGILLLIASVGYVITNSAKLLLPTYDNYKTELELIFIIPMLSEVGFGIWLLIKGIKIQLAE